MTKQMQPRDMTIAQLDRRISRLSRELYELFPGSSGKEIIRQLRICRVWRAEKLDLLNEACASAERVA